PIHVGPHIDVDTATTETYPLSLHDALPICRRPAAGSTASSGPRAAAGSSPCHGGRVIRCRWRCTSGYLGAGAPAGRDRVPASPRSEEHTSELQSRENLVCRLLLEKKKKALP